MGHHHHQGAAIKGNKLIATILLNVSITIAQVIGAIMSSSLSLMTDALHNLSDVVALVISYIANRLTSKKHTSQQSFGYKRAEILAAFFNATTLLAISVYLIVEAIKRLTGANEVIVQGDVVIWLAVFSVLANGASVLLIHNDAKNSMNMKAAYLHLFSDMLSSVAVLIGGVLMLIYDIYWIDSVLSILIGIYLIVASWKLFIKTIKVLMQFTPVDLDMEEIVLKITSIDGIKNVHHIHLWQLNDHDYHFEGHVDMKNDLPLSEVDHLLGKIRECLFHDFSITHVTIQPEFQVCSDKSIVGQH
ncbi:cation diffusion facilitator family transporter [bacterium]|nr:cation diffusion facilitator family transporter [bacterium]